MRNGYMPPHKREEVKQIIDSQGFGSDFNFLNIHKGLRKAEVSVLIAPYGGGKSTLMRTLIIELAKRLERIFIFLSEEKSDFYLWQLHYSFDRIFPNSSEETRKTFMENIWIESQLEIDDDKKNTEWFIQFLKDEITVNGTNILIFDNYTTSFFNRTALENQALGVEKFKEIACNYCVAFLLVTHTQKGTDVYSGNVTGESVRGNATTVNLGSYNYVLHTFYKNDPIRSFIVVDKSRYHTDANKKVFELFFDRETKLFSGDKPSSFEEMKKLINMARKGGNLKDIDLSYADQMKKI